MNTVFFKSIFFAFILSTPLALQAQYSVEDFNKASELIDKIAPYFGDINTRKPTLKLEKIAEEPACYTVIRGEGTIFIDPDLFNFIRQDFQGQHQEPALAFVIAHELTHHYKHKNIQIPPNLLALYEKQADEEGFFHARQAGYDLNDALVGEVLNFIYKRYPNIGVEGYPTLVERQQACQERIKTIYEKKLPEMFLLASYFYGQTEYAHASRCFQYVIDAGYVNEALYNNLGLTYLQAFYKSIPDDDKVKAFKCPIDYDGRQVRAFGLKKVTNPPFDNKEALIKEAKNAFDLAISYNKTYEKAYTNLAILYFLQERLVQAEAKIQEILEFQEALSPQSKVMQGIILAYKDDKKKANERFDEAVKEKSRIALYNEGLVEALKNLKHSIITIPEDELRDIKYDLDDKMKITGEFKRLDPLKEEQALKDAGIHWNPADIQTITLGNGQDRMFLKVGTDSFVSNEGPFQQFYTHYYSEENNARKVSFNLIYINDNFKATSGYDVKIGSSITELLEKYGRPDTNNNPDVMGDAVFRYNDAGIIFLIRYGKVVGWFLYREN